MQFKLSSLLIILAGSAPVLSTTNGIGAPPATKRMHKNIARSFADNSNGLQKRDTSGPGTWYDIHMGPVACDGKHYQPQDHVSIRKALEAGMSCVFWRMLTIYPLSLSR